MNVLLDTHAFAWWCNEPEKITSTARSFVASRQHRVLVSAASAWELAIKANLGKFQPVSFVFELRRHLANEAFETLPIDMEHSVRAGLLPMHHRDPFDRLIVAQAQVENAVIVSADGTLDNYDIKRIW
jgi:PIN domain nuclease of toxin-antitoxin system